MSRDIKMLPICKSKFTPTIYKPSKENLINMRQVIKVLVNIGKHNNHHDIRFFKVDELYKLINEYQIIPLKDVEDALSVMVYLGMVSTGQSGAMHTSWEKMNSWVKHN